MDVWHMISQIAEWLGEKHSSHGAGLTGIWLCSTLLWGLALGLWPGN